MISPIEHFEINFHYKLIIFYKNFYLTTFFLYAFCLNIFLFWIWLKLNAKNNFISNNLLVLFLENFFFFFLNLFLSQLKNSKRSLQFYPIVLSTFFLIFFFNFTSLISYNLSLTGHIIITLFFGFSLFFFFFILAFLNYRIYYLNFFLPKQVPFLLMLLLLFIEIISYFIRPLSLSIRLFANMLAGHALLNIFTNFFIFVIKNYIILFFVPLIFCFLVMILEVVVAIIQAYVFYILLLVYLNDSYNLH
jgi:ATP synthase subunit 6